MTFEKNLAFEFLGDIAFERSGGTPAEDRVVKLICGAVRRAGAVPKVETFTIHTFTKGTAGLEILAPYKKQYEAKPMALTGSFPKGGKVLPLAYIQAIGPAALEDVKGKALYGYNICKTEHFKDMRSAGVMALVNIFEAGKMLRYQRFGERAVKRFGRIPTIAIPFEAGMEMVQKNASKARITLEQGEKKALSKNVIAVIPGTSPNVREEIIVCGHHDSVPDSPGANDNGGGAAIMVALLKHFVKNPTRRALRFIWFGSEEHGLLGSQAYVRAHEKEMERVKMVVNMDGAGRLVDCNYVVTTGQDDLRHFVDIIGKERGLDLRVTEGAFGSDGVPFTWHEIPCINITRGADSNIFVHTLNDNFKTCGADGLAPNGELALEIIQRLGNARQFPFKRGFNETVRKNLKDSYDRMLLSRREMPKWCR